MKVQDKKIIVDGKEWHVIHDFLRGWGLCEHIPDNKVIVEDHPDADIPWSVVHSKVIERHIYLYDAHRLLNIDIFKEDIDPEDIYSRLQPLLKAEAEERIKNYKPIQFTKITIPKINRPFPKL